MACNATTIRDLLLYMLWADRLTLAAVRQVPPEDLNREAGVSFGSALAIAISWSEHHSILWAIIQGFFSWFYVIYYALTHQ